MESPTDNPNSQFRNFNNRKYNNNNINNNNNNNNYTHFNNVNRFDNNWGSTLTRNNNNNFGHFNINNNRNNNRGRGDYDKTNGLWRRSDSNNNNKNDVRISSVHFRNTSSYRGRTYNFSDRKNQEHHSNYYTTEEFIISSEGDDDNVNENVISSDNMRVMMKFINQIKQRVTWDFIDRNKEIWKKIWKTFAVPKQRDINAEQLESLLIVYAMLPVDEKDLSEKIKFPTYHQLSAVMENLLSLQISKEDEDSKSIIAIRARVILNSIKRSLKFTWNEASQDIRVMITSVLNILNGKLELRSHLKDINAISSLFSEIDSEWAIQSRTHTDVYDKSGSPVSNYPWVNPLLSWLLNAENFVPILLPRLLKPNSDQSGYRSFEEYIDVMLRVYIGVTFYEGWSNFSPKCKERIHNRECGRALILIVDQGDRPKASNCRNNNCKRSAMYSCRIHSYHAVCGECHKTVQSSLLSSDARSACTNVYDGKISNISWKGTLHISELTCRHLPQVSINWRTTYRLNSPNLVGIIKLNAAKQRLSPSHRIYWAEIEAYDNKTVERVRTVHKTIELKFIDFGPACPELVALDNFKTGDHIAIIDCKVFVPEYINVLLALEKQKSTGLPFSNGSLLGIGEYSMKKSYIYNLSSNELLHELVNTMIQRSTFNAIVDIRNQNIVMNGDFTEQLMQQISKVIIDAKFDSGQLTSFLSALESPVHCTEGPPGTGKSYLGVALTRAFILIQYIWKKMCPDAGSAPILVLSYKNHAIDEFMKDLLKLDLPFGCNKFIRIGKTDEESLKRYTEHNFYQSRYDLNSIMQKIENLHKEKLKVMEYSSGCASSLVLLDEETIDSTTIAKHLRNAIWSIYSKMSEDEIESILGTPAHIAPWKPKDEITSVQINSDSNTDSNDYTDSDNSTILSSLLPEISYIEDNPERILEYWINGFIPVPRCSIVTAGNRCKEAVYMMGYTGCNSHTCTFFISGDHHPESRCKKTIKVKKNKNNENITTVCSDHKCKVCNSEICTSSLYCDKHSCNVCIRLGVPPSQVDKRTPRKTCSEHEFSLCTASHNDTFCDKIATQNGRCEEHQRNCSGRTRKKKPCTSKAISAEIPFCEMHAKKMKNTNNAKNNNNNSIASFDKCMGITSKKEPCKSTPPKGSRFCDAHKSQETNDDDDSHNKIVITKTNQIESIKSDNLLIARDNENCNDNQIEVKTHEENLVVSNQVDPFDDQNGIVDIPFDDIIEDDTFNDNIDEMFIEDFPDAEIHRREVYGESENEGIRRIDEIIEVSDTKDYDEDIESQSIQNYCHVNSWNWVFPIDQRLHQVRQFFRLAIKIFKLMKSKIRKSIHELSQEYKSRDSLFSSKMYEDRTVICGTVVGCIKRIRAISIVQPFCMIVEEASEVLETVLVSCLVPSITKLELIGDYKQLQPCLNNSYDFQRTNNLSSSLFERLVLSKVPPCTLSLLDVQYRMRKSICDFTRSFYSDITPIIDAEKTILQTIQYTSSERKSREVPGILPHIYFWSHRHPTQPSDVGCSHVNKREAEMVISLALYLVSCGVKSKDIAILTPYSGQFRHLHSELNKYNNNIIIARNNTPRVEFRISTIDRFQGDESDIVIVSMVIDENFQQSFVNIPNRMIVLLSRARLGMYVVGNFGFFKHNPPDHWKKSLELFNQNGYNDSDRHQVDEIDVYHGPQIGDTLPICCPLHRSSIKEVDRHSELRLGFCSAVCNQLLPCGHNCVSHCHFHTTPEQHSKCTVIVKSRCLRHTEIACYLKRESFRCLIQMEVGLVQCGHTKKLKCSEYDKFINEIETYNCEEASNNSFIYPDCKHTVSCKCYEFTTWNRDPSTAPPCNHEVTLTLSPCSHSRSIICWNYKHLLLNGSELKCIKTVERNLPRCGHSVKMGCIDSLQLNTWQGISANGSIVIEGVNYGPLDHHCTSKVTFERICGHHIKQLECSKAFEFASEPPVCLADVNIHDPSCGHSGIITCAKYKQLKVTEVPKPITHIHESEIKNVYSDAPLFKCKSNISVKRNCGHEFSSSCHSIRSFPLPECIEKISDLHPYCGHTFKIQCSEQSRYQNYTRIMLLNPTTSDRFPLSSIDEVTSDLKLSIEKLDPSLPRCELPVKFKKLCGHTEVLPCWKVIKLLLGTLAPSLCMIDVTKTLPCGHSTTTKCNHDISTISCHAKCEKQCINFSVCNSYVSTQCSDESPTCNRKSVWNCPTSLHKYKYSQCRQGIPANCPDCSISHLKSVIDDLRDTMDSNRLPAELKNLPVTPHESLLPYLKPFSLSIQQSKEFIQGKYDLFQSYRKEMQMKLKNGIDHALRFEPLYVPIMIPFQRIPPSFSQLQKNDWKTFGIGLYSYLITSKNFERLLSGNQPPSLLFGFGISFHSSEVNINFAQFKQNNNNKGRGNKYKNKNNNNNNNNNNLIIKEYRKVNDMIIHDEKAIFLKSPYPILITHYCNNTSILQFQNFSYQYIPPSLNLQFKRIEPHAVAATSSSSSSSHDHRTCFIIDCFKGTICEGVNISKQWDGDSFGCNSSFDPSLVKSLSSKLKFFHPTECVTGSAYLSKVQKDPELLVIMSLEYSMDLFVSDAIDALKMYVSHCKTTQCFAHPLIILALALIEEANLHHHLSHQLITALRSCYPNISTRWLPVPNSNDNNSNQNGVVDRRMNFVKQKVKHEWEKYKQEKNVECVAMDELMILIGLEKVKRSAFELYKLADQLQEMNDQQRINTLEKILHFNYAFIGNPGTGKTTVAKLFGRILYSSHIRSKNILNVVTSQELIDRGSEEFRNVIIPSTLGGVLFIDEAYTLDPAVSNLGRSIVTELLHVIEEMKSKISIIIAGYHDEIHSKLYCFNPGLKDRFTTIEFDDYDQFELKEIMKLMLHQANWSTTSDDVFNIAIRQLMKKANRKGFSNARAVRDVIDSAIKSAIARNSNQIDTCDILGVRPSVDAPKIAQILDDADRMIGFRNLKSILRSLIELSANNYDLQVNGIAPQEMNLHRLFLGNPGTGKSTFASLYARLLKEIGVISDGSAIFKTASDLISQYRGSSQQKTNEILSLAEGKVLVIDESYNLMNSWFGLQVLDVIAEHIDGNNDNIVIVLIDSSSEMRDMLRSANPGLARRFPFDSAHDYSRVELHQIFHRFENVIQFDDWESEDCLNALMRGYDNEGYDYYFNTVSDQREILLSLFSKLMKIPGWANGHDVEHIKIDSIMNRNNRISDDEIKREIQYLDIISAINALLTSR